MEGFCGYLSKDKQVIEGELLNEMIVQLSTPLTPDHYMFTHSRFTFGVSYVKGPTTPMIIETSRFFLFISGRIDQGQIRHLMNQKDETLNELLKRNFDSVLSEIRGDFILILYDKVVQSLTCVRDQIGTRPFYYVEDSQYLFVSSEIAAFRALPIFSFQIDEQWIADSLSLVKSEKHRSPYIGIKKLMPGNKMVFDRGLKNTQYWALEPQEELAHLNFNSAVSLFSEKLNQAVERRVNGISLLGSELSGGLDSSGVTAYASKIIKPEAQTFFALSHVLSTEDVQSRFPFNDELIYSKALVDSIDLNGHFLCSSEGEGILNSVKRSFTIQSGPSQQGFHFYSDVLFKKAALHGIETLLSGFGGDEGVTSKAPGYFREMKMQGNKAKFQKELLIRYSRNGLGPIQAQLRTAVHYYCTPLIDWSKLPGERKMPIGMDKILDSIDNNFLSSLEIRKRFQEKYVVADADTLMERQAKQLMHNHLPQRMEYSFLNAKSYGITYSYPLLDIDLLQFYLALPAEFKFRNGIGRALFRESLADMVPDQIRLRDDKSGYTIPSVYSRILQDHDRINDLIIRCRNQNKFHYLNYSYLLAWLKSIKHISHKKKNRFPGSGPFMNAIQVLLLQEMQRTGEFESGIQT